MAKKIRFPLQMNGTDVRTIEELRENFNLESVLGYFANGKLVTWLKDRYYDNEAMAVEALSAEDSELNQKLMSILGVSVDEEAEEIDMETIQRRNEKFILLRQITDDKEIIDNVDFVAFNQDDLLDILDEEAEKIYLCQGEFEIPLSVKNITYIGLQNPIVLLRAYDNVNFSSLNLKFVDICFGWDISSTTNADRLYQAERMIEKQEFDKAIPILEQLVTEENPRSFNILSQIYDHVYPSKENKDKLPDINERGAKTGDVFSWIETGKEFPEIKRLLHKLVAKGNKTAMAYLGYIYDVEDDFENAIKYFEMGAEKNSIICCDFLLGHYREDGADNGSKIPMNLRSNKKAIYYGRKGALLGHADVANRLGVIYEKGELVAQDMNEAVKYYKLSAEHGNSFAQNNLANCYYSGDGITQDYKKAFEWYRKAAEQGNINAQNNLASCYYHGHGIPQDYEKTFEWYRKAAEQGHVDAQNNLGACYQNGYGVEQDYEKALYWYDKSTSDGNEAAKENAEFLRGEMEKSSQLLSDETLEELRKNDDELRKSLSQTGQELRDELKSITDELRSDGFFNLFG